MLTTLYSLIISPIQFTTSFPPKIYKRPSIICVCIAGLGLLQGASLPLFLPLSIMSIISIIILSVLYAMIVDFFAQLWGCKGQSLNLFIWINTTLITFGLFPLLWIIKFYFSPLLVICLQLLIILVMSYWQYRIICYLYKVNKIKGVLLWLSPYLINIGLVLLMFGITLF